MRRALLALLIALCTLAPAGAQSTGGNAYSVCLIATSAAVSCGNLNNGIVVGFENISQTAQTVTVECAVNGIAVEEIGALGITQKVTNPPPGKPFRGNLICTPSGAPVATNTGDGIGVWVTSR